MTDPLTQLRNTGHCELPIQGGSRHDTGAAIGATRSRAYRLGKALGVKVTTATGWGTMYVEVTPLRASLDRARAAAQLMEGMRGPRREVLANAVGAELFGDGRLAGLVTCRICGCLGDEGDECGRLPVGHRLQP